MTQLEKIKSPANNDASPLLAEDDASKYSEIILPAGGITLERVEKLLIEQALERFDGNQTKAAQCLGMSRDTIRYRIKKFGIGRD